MPIRTFIIPAKKRTWTAVGLVVVGVCAMGARRWEPVELHVLISGAFTAAYQEISPRYEKESGNHLVMAPGASMGTTPTAIPMRLERKEPADVAIMARDALDKLAAKGQVIADSETDLGLSKIAMAVREGAPLPDISTDEALRETLLKAKSIAYSDSSSGVYLSTVLFKKLGISEQVAAKSHMIPGTPVGENIARGEEEIGFQQVSELKPVKGIHIVGLLPEDVQKVTTFSAGVVTTSAHPDEALALVRFLASDASYAAIRASGMEPAHAAGKK